MIHPTILSDNEMDRAEYVEKSRQFIHNAIELALSLGDFHKEIHCHCTPKVVIKKTAERIDRLISFESTALYLVDEETSDMKLSLCSPGPSQQIVEAELDFLIQNGFVAWAIRERRGIVVFSKDGKRQILLHVMATYSCTRGLFLGIFPPNTRRLPDASLEILSIILRNATNAIESLTYSNQLRQQKEELEKSVAEKTQRLVHYEKQLMQGQHMETVAALAGGVAHQFNNALTGLIGNLDLMAMSVNGQQNITRYIDRIRPITERMSSLTNQLLTYAQGGKFMASDTTLNAILQDALPAIGRALKKTVQFKMDLPDKPIALKADLIQLRMAILAIVNNADEAISEDGIVHLRVEIVQSNDLPETIKQELNPGEYAQIAIQDTGKGMDPEGLRRIFQPFYSTKFEGRGLSMAAVFSIFKHHGGWIAVHSAVNEGTTVYCYLPTLSKG